MNEFDAAVQALAKAPYLDDVDETDFHAEQIRRAAAATFAAGPWIPVTERMPGAPSDTMYLIWWLDEPIPAWWTGDHFQSLHGNELKRLITHWCELRRPK